MTNLHSQIQATVDAAVLHGAREKPDNAVYHSSNISSIGNMVPEGTPEWYSSMIKYYYANLASKTRSSIIGDSQITVDADGSGSLTLKVKSDIGLTFGSILGDSKPVTVTGTAWRDSLSLPVCMLALNKYQDDTISMTGTADVTASGCVVLSNSSSSSALSQSGSSTMTADAICGNGGYYGTRYYPLPRTGCSQVADPLLTDFNDDLSHIDTTSCDQYNDTSKPKTFFSGNNTVYPGVYCGGISVENGVTANLKPGVYVMRDGPFRIRSGGEVVGDGVTIILAGTSWLDIHSQGDLNIKAPQTGYFAGIAIAQLPDSTTGTSANLVIGGGSIEIEGIAYFPEQLLTITGAGDISMNANQFAIVADTISIEGNGQLNIGASAGYIAAGLPQLPVIDADTRVKLTM